MAQPGRFKYEYELVVKFKPQCINDLFVFMIYFVIEKLKIKKNRAYM